MICWFVFSFASLCLCQFKIAFFFRHQILHCNFCWENNKLQSGEGI